MIKSKMSQDYPKSFLPPSPTEFSDFRAKKLNEPPNIHTSLSLTDKESISRPRTKVNSVNITIPIVYKLKTMLQAVNNGTTESVV